MNQESAHKLVIGLLIATLFVVGFNALRVSRLDNLGSFAPTAAAVLGSPAAQTSGGSSGIIPTGVPAIYGQELGISFDDVTPDDPQKADAAIGVLSSLDQRITLSGADKERYINVAYKLENGISCEYCCGARAIIFANGEPACGCAHSYAMRGLAKYLITEHGSEYTDEQILEELGKWKVLFFPDIHAQKAEVLKSNGIPVNYISLASNKYRGIEKGAASAGGSMVGGC